MFLCDLQHIQNLSAIQSCINFQNWWNFWQWNFAILHHHDAEWWKILIIFRISTFFLISFCLWQFFYKIEIKLWLIIMWDFQLIWIQFWFGIFFRFFPIIFVIQNIRAQSLPNHKHFEVYYSYKKACRVSIWRPIYRLIVDTLLQLFMKK